MGGSGGAGWFVLGFVAGIVLMTVIVIVSIHWK